MNMILKYETYPFSAKLGWSISRWEAFDKCKRLYYYLYYGKYVDIAPPYKISMLKSLTSVPLETGNVVHDVMEAFLKRLQKSDSNIDEEGFFDYAKKKAKEYFSKKSFIEIYYRQATSLDMEAVDEKIGTCLRNFIASPIYNWLFMKAILNRDNWMIEPEGYGETRLNGLKAYCKMDFLFPVDGHIYIIDWKTGKKDTYKHSRQLIGYCAAASSNFNIPWKLIFPKIVYLFPVFEELEVNMSEHEIGDFMDQVKRQTDEMLAFCINPEENIPEKIDAFPMNPSPSLCENCRFQELCFPERMREKNPCPSSPVNGGGD